ncbi:uncharacterized protein LOC111086393 [Limulus polyphemus]|uniref:Uncharacterized protein LOC111086393 n=1 Tax=Limulus polyphemus TaxID=6850 RepID=A0ABM1SM83_LIMPO|nr:uncharacterized protein LOC111086393 [Limulus polyphemus]
MMKYVVFAMLLAVASAQILADLSYHSTLWPATTSQVVTHTYRLGTPLYIRRYIRVPYTLTPVLKVPQWANYGYYYYHPLSGLRRSVVLGLEAQPKEIKLE